MPSQYFYLLKIYKQTYNTHYTCIYNNNNNNRINRMNTTKTSQQQQQQNQLFFTQICQLCKLIIIYQSKMQPIRQSLFTKYSLTDDVIWNTIFGQRKQAGGKQLYQWIKFNMNKNNLMQINSTDCIRFVQRYDQIGYVAIRKDDLWRVFKPKLLPMFDCILHMKKSKSCMPKLVQIDYRAKQQIVNILEKIIEFEKYAQKMRENISYFKRQLQSYKLKEIQPKYLQLLLIQYMPNLRLKDCQLIIQHIIGHNINKQKIFYTFFLPQKTKQLKINPINSINLNQSQQINLQMYSKSKKIWSYGKKHDNHNNPIYLCKK